MTNSITRHFADLPDPRRPQGKRHCLSDMIVIAIGAVICGADFWSDVVDFGKAKHKWFKTFLGLPNGIPSQDTFERVFAQLDPDAFEACIQAGTHTLAGSTKGQLVAINGKRIRRSFEQAWRASTATHLVSAFVSANATVFGQLAVDTKENEIVVIPRLLLYRTCMEPRFPSTPWAARRPSPGRLSRAAAIIVWRSRTISPRCTGPFRSSWTT
ncbi:MAG: ISAs1 family transposase [Phycisphaerae bacterium]